MQNVALVSIIVIVFGLCLMYIDYRASGRARKGAAARKPRGLL
jgi:uncharacterized membrane protein